MSDSNSYLISSRVRKYVVIFVVVFTVISYMMVFVARQSELSAHSQFFYSFVSENSTTNTNNITEVRIIHNHNKTYFILYPTKLIFRILQKMPLSGHLMSV